MSKRKRSMSLAGSSGGRTRAISTESQAARFMRKASRGFLSKSPDDTSDKEIAPESEPEEIDTGERDQMAMTLERMRALGFLADEDEDEAEHDAITPRSAAVSENVVRMLAKYDIEGNGSDEESDETDAATLKKWKARHNVSVKFVVDDALLMEKTLLQGELTLVRAIFTTASTEYFDEIAQSIVILFEANNAGDMLLQHVVQVEIQRASSATSFRETIFREDTISSKVFSHYMKLVGKDYLTMLVAPYISKVVSAPAQYYGSEAAMGRFVVLIEALIKRITLSTDMMPPQIQSLCFYVEREVRLRSPESVLTALGNLIFLRFINHAIVAPVGFKLLDEKPPPDGTRALVVMAKVLQNVINGITVSESSNLHRTNGLVHLYSERVHHFLKTLPRPLKSTALSQGVRIQRDFALEQLQRYLRNHMEEVDRTYSSDNTGEESGDATD